MSRAYRISVSESQNRVVRAEDRVSTHLELIEVLPCDQMSALLAEELEKQGFERKNGQLVRKDKEVNITVDPNSGEVTVSTEASQKVQLATTREGRAYDDGDRKKAKEDLKKEAVKELDRQEAAKTSDLQTKVTDRLERHLGDVRHKLDQVVNRVTAEALKRKVAQLGQIKEITEDAQSGSLTIVVEV
jgi:FtsH ternary system domain X5